MAKRIIGSTPKRDGYRMPAEFEPQSGVWMLWPERNDNWRDGAKPAQRAFLDVAEAILQFEPVTVCVSAAQYQNARERLPRAVRVVEMASNDAWIRDCGPTFLVNDRGGLRAVDWTFNAWGGLVDGLYFPWDLDDQVAQKVCELERVDSVSGVPDHAESRLFPVDALDYRLPEFLLIVDHKGCIHWHPPVNNKHTESPPCGVGFIL